MTSGIALSEKTVADLAEILAAASMGCIEVTSTTAKFAKDPERAIRLRKARTAATRPPMGKAGHARPRTTRFTITRFGDVLRDFRGANAAAEAISYLIGALTSLTTLDPAQRARLTQIESALAAPLERAHGGKCRHHDFVVAGRNLLAN